MHIDVIGMGPGNVDLLTRRAVEAIRESDIILGAPRLMERLDKIGEINATRMPCQLGEIKSLIQAHKDKKKIGILASGDIGFYSIAKWVQKEFKEAYKVECINGISSLQYFCNKLNKSYEDIKTISVHGRENKVLGAVMSYSNVFVLTGGTYKVQDVCKMLCKAGLEDVSVYIGEKLSYEEERVLSGRAKDFVNIDFEDLAVMLIEKSSEEEWDYVTPGIPDEAFIRGKVPMTKEEVRSVCLSKLRIKKSDILYDVGAGTGSVAIEMARQAKAGWVYALEKKEEAIELIHANKEKFRAYNMDVIQAECPKGLEALPQPDKVFIGGSTGKLQAIIGLIASKNPKVRIVVTAITLETLQEVLEAAKLYHFEVDCTHIMSATSKKVGGYHMMMGQNPIFILTMEREAL